MRQRKIYIKNDNFCIIVVLGVSDFSIMSVFIIMMVLGMGRGLIIIRELRGFIEYWSVPRGWLLTVLGSGERYYPFIVSLFVFLLIVINIWGLSPYIFTPTAHVGLTVELSFTIIVAVTNLVTM